MKNLIKITYAVLALTLFTSLFFSCKKDKNLPTPEKTEQTPTPENENDEATTTATNENVAKALTLQQSGIMNTDSTNYCDCFSIFNDIDWDADEAVIIAQLEAIFANLSDEDLEALFTPVCTADGLFFENECVAICNGATNFTPCLDIENSDWEDCFEFIYPLTIVFPDGTTQAVNDDEELLTVVENWYIANPNSDDDPTLQFPVEVILAVDGSTVTVNDEDDLDDLLEDCEDYSFEDCFTFVFPLELVFPDSTVIAINSIAEGEAAVEAWDDANPNATDDVEIVFPLNVTLADGTIQTINNEDELDDLFDDCYGDMGGCFILDGTKNALTQKIIQQQNALQN